jgi:hypothetical protein
MIDTKEVVTVKAYPARADKRTVIRISEGGVDTNVGRAPRGEAITVDGVPVPGTALPQIGGGRGGAAGGGRGGAAPK